MRSFARSGAYALAVALSCLTGAKAQVSAPNNNPPFGSYVGHMGANANPVQVRHNGNYPIQWFTDSIQRMQLWNTRTGTVNGFNGIRQNGYVGISNQPLFFSSAAGPFSRLHLADSSNSNSHLDWAQQQGFRPWMRNGITMTGNRDQCYVGQKYNGTGNHNDSTDLVLQWSDNADGQQWATDRLRFLFTSGYSPGQPYGARSREGLESFRVYIPNDTSAFVGIGDWWRATVQNGGAAVDPTERLDVLDRTIRIRQLLPDYNNDTLSRVGMVDGTGRLHWRRINTWPSSGGGGGTGCEWSLSGGANGNNLWTAVGSGASCPNDDNLVGIGIVSPSAKLHVKYNAVDGQPIVRGGLFQISGDHFSKIAGEFTTIGEGTTHGGVFARASSALSEQWSEGNIAVRAWAVADASGFTHTNRGVQAGADVTVDNQVKNNVGVDVVNNIDYNASVDYNFGIRAKLTTSYGNITDNHAGLFEVWTDCGATQTNYGLKARAAGADMNYGIYASAAKGPCGNTAWAGYFVGDVQAGATYLPSDAGLKTGIADVEPASAADILALLNVHSYHYNTEAYPQMGLPEGP